MALIADREFSLLLLAGEKNQTKKPRSPWVRADGSPSARGFGYMIHFSIIEFGEGACINYG